MTSRSSISSRTGSRLRYRLTYTIYTIYHSRCSRPWSASPMRSASPIIPFNPFSNNSILVESLNIHGPPSISIPFPPFSGKEVLAPPPPPPPISFHASLYHKADKYIRQHPYVASALVLTVGLGLSRVGRTFQFSHDWPPRLRKIRKRGVVKDGILKEAVGEFDEYFRRSPLNSP